jgi:hypothetical protein
MAIDLTQSIGPEHRGGSSGARHVNNYLTSHPWVLNLLGARLTVFDVFGALGDTLLTELYIAISN